MLSFSIKFTKTIAFVLHLILVNVIFLLYSYQIKPHRYKHNELKFSFTVWICGSIQVHYRRTWGCTTVYFSNPV